MIELIDRPEQAQEYWIGPRKCRQHPVYMVKDGEEYFIANRDEPETPGGLYFAGIRKFLSENGGAYFYFYGHWPHPLEMLQAMRGRYTFDSAKGLFVDSRERGVVGGHFLDFGGNFREVSTAFFYRIYDEELMSRVKAAAAPIIAKSRKR